MPVWGALVWALAVGALDLDAFWSSRRVRSRNGADWLHVLTTLSNYSLLNACSRWKNDNYAARSLDAPRPSIHHSDLQRPAEAAAHTRVLAASSMRLA